LVHKFPDPRPDERARDSELLAALLRAFAETAALPELLGRLGDLLAAFLEAEHAAVWIYSARGDEMRGFPAGAPAGEVRVPAGRGLTGAALQARHALTSADPQIDPRFDPSVDQPAGADARTLLCLPLTHERELVGVVVAADKRGGAFGSRDEERLRGVTPALSGLLERARRLDELERAREDHESILDGLSLAVIKVAPDGVLARANAAARRLFRRDTGGLPGCDSASFFAGANAWVLELLATAAELGAPRTASNRELALLPPGPPPSGVAERRRRTASVHAQAVPLQGAAGTPAGSLLVIEDVTREKRLRGALTRYVDSDVAERLLEEGEGGALGGRVQKATILFADIRDFTRLTERLGAQETVRLLNDAFGLLVDCVVDRRGTLDKYIGDGLMAVFGAPYSMGDDAENAVGAVLDMLRALRGFNQMRLERGLERLRMGFGLNTDEVLSGNIGSPRRMDYTVIGDGVNLAARLEGANRDYGTELLVSEFTLAELKRPYLLREVDRLRVRGRHRPVAVFELLDYAPEELLPHLRYVVALYNEGLERYRRREWDAARRMFDEALQQRSDDGPARTYRERCAFFERQPPPDDWDGVWDLTRK
jgi:adenylate cyclase